MAAVWMCYVCGVSACAECALTRPTLYIPGRRSQYTAMPAESGVPSQFPTLTPSSNAHVSLADCYSSAGYLAAAQPDEGGPLRGAPQIACARRFRWRRERFVTRRMHVGRSSSSAALKNGMCQSVVVLTGEMETAGHRIEIAQKSNQQVNGKSLPYK